MPKRPEPTEQDLLDIVEGRLAPERADAMRTMLRADPALARRLQAMVADRAAIRQLTLDAQRTAPTHLAADAVTRAERDTLVGADSESRRAGAWPLRRIAAIVALVLVLGAALTGSLMYLSSGNNAPSDRVAVTTAAPPSGSPGGVFEVPSFDAGPRAASAPLPDLSGAGLASAALDQSTTVEPPAPTAPKASARSPAPSFASSQEQVARWNREVAEKIAGESGPSPAPSAGGGAALPDATVGGMRLSEAAKLAAEGRLRITVRPGSNAVDARSIQAGTSLGAGVGQVVEQRSSDAYTVELTTRYDPELTALQDAIAALAERLAGDSFGPRTEVRFFAAPQGAQGAAPAIPSFRADDVLWWTRPVSTWERAISIRAPVEVLPAAD